MSATDSTTKTTPDAPAKGASGAGNGNGKGKGAKGAQGAQGASGNGNGAAKASTPRPPREGSAMHAAITILKTARGPLTPQEIYDRAKAKGLAGGLKGKTPVATLGAQLATANKKGVHVTRPEPGKYALRK